MNGADNLQLQHTQDRKPTPQNRKEEIPVAKDILEQAVKSGLLKDLSSVNQFLNGNTRLSPREQAELLKDLLTETIIEARDTNRLEILEILQDSNNPIVVAARTAERSSGAAKIN